MKSGLISAILISLFIGAVLGMNYGLSQYRHLWDEGRNGIRILNDRLAEDKSRRLGMAVITEEHLYTTQSVSTDFLLEAYFRKR